MTKRFAKPAPIVFWEDERALLQARIAELEAAQPVAVAECADPLEVMVLFSRMAERMAEHYGGWASSRWGNRKPSTPDERVIMFIDALPDHQCKCEGECEGDSDDSPEPWDWDEAVRLILRHGEPGSEIDRLRFLRKHAPDEVFA